MYVFVRIQTHTKMYKICIHNICIVYVTQLAIADILKVNCKCRLLKRGFFFVLLSSYHRARM